MQAFTTTIGKIPITAPTISPSSPRINDMNIGVLMCANVSTIEL